MTAQIHHIHRKPRLVEPPRDYAEEQFHRELDEFFDGLERSFEPTRLDRLCNTFVDGIAFLWDNALAIGLGFVFGMLAVTIPAIILSGFVG